MSATVRVGVLNDIADTGAGPDDLAYWLEREVDRLHSSGRIAKPVEFVHAYGLGLPSGTAEAIEQAFEELVAQDVILIVGPGIDDNALVAAPLAERLRVPTINWAGAERARGRYMFQLQSGTPQEEAALIAEHLAQGGFENVAVLHDLSSAGTRYLRCLESEAARLGLTVSPGQGVAPGTDDVQDAVSFALARDPDAFVYLGLGGAAHAIADALATRGWQGERITNAVTPSDDVSAACDGWAYVAPYSDANRTLQGICETHGVPPGAAIARGHDLARLVAEGLARAQDHSREGMRAALEQVKWLPAAQGEDGTLLGFGVQDRAALHGRYLVMRRWIDGGSVEVPRA